MGLQTHTLSPEGETEKEGEAAVEEQSIIPEEEVETEAAPEQESSEELGPGVLGFPCDCREVEKEHQGFRLLLVTVSKVAKD